LAARRRQLVIAIQEAAKRWQDKEKRGFLMITLPIWLLALCAIVIAIAMYSLGRLKKATKSRQKGYVDGHYLGYCDGYADCQAEYQARAKSYTQAEQTTKSEASS
jgi:hypothetical protein